MIGFQLPVTLSSNAGELLTGTVTFFDVFR
jgi:hypothetical protein